MMSPRTILLTTVFVLGSMAVASAAGANQVNQANTPPRGPLGGPGAVMFNLLDENGDGALDATEIEALAAAIVETADTNGDGKITRDEVGGVMGAFGQFGQRGGERGHRGGHEGGQYGQGQQFGQGEGRMGGHHNHPQRGQQFGQAQPGQGPMGGQYGQGPQGQGPMGGQYGQGPQGQGPMLGGGFRDGLGARFAERLGIDEDGLTKDEFVTAQTERFTALDTDGDGVVTAAEFAAHMKEFPRPRYVR